MSKERRLGRGLEALLGQIPSRAPAPQSPPPAAAPVDPFGGIGQQSSAAPAVALLAAGTHADTFHQAAAPTLDILPGLRRVSIGEVVSNPSQPRQEFDSGEIESLSESIAAHGLLQPIVVRRVDDRYELVAGERRLRAAKKAGLTDLPANVIEADDRNSFELAIVENLHRKDLNALEKAASFQQYLERYGCTQEELATRLKLDRSTIANLIRLLELPEEVQSAIRTGKISQGHARALLPLGEEREQIEFCRRIEKEGLSVRDTESMVQKTLDDADDAADALGLIDQEGQRKKAGKARSGHIVELEQQFRAALGLKVKLASNAKGRGKLTIQFRNHEEFERLQSLLCGEQVRSRTA